MTRRRMLRWLVLVHVLAAGPVLAHSSPPGLVQVGPAASGAAGGATVVEFRLPRLDGVVPPIRIALPEGVVEIAPPVVIELPDARLWRYRLAGAPSALAGHRIDFPGLALSGIDVVVRAGDWTGVARAATPFVDLPGTGLPGGGLGVFAVDGVRHILLGPDHLLFLLGLMLLVGAPRSVLATVTSFTLAHSVSLAVATIGVLTPPTVLLNALIALSVLALAIEAVGATRGTATLLVRRPWLGAFGFGLLHGFGFASALTEAGLPRAALAGALLFFNLGVEAGQLGVVVAAWLLASGFANLRFRLPGWSVAAPAYAIGIPGAYWTIDRGLAALGLQQ